MEEEIILEFKEDDEYVRNFYEFIDAYLEKKNKEPCFQKTTKMDIVRNFKSETGYKKEEMIKKILNGRKKAPSRDFIIALCLTLDIAGTDLFIKALYSYDHNYFDEHDDREGVIWDYISKNEEHGYKEELTFKSLNKKLIENNYPPLKLDGKIEKEEKPKQFLESEYIIRNSVNESCIYYGDRYSSLSSEYSLFGRLNFSGFVEVKNKNTKEIFVVTNDKDSIQGHPELEYFYKQLCLKIKAKEKELLNILNDTKYYKNHERSSARLIDDSVCVFTEQFNYTLPELSEYFVLRKVKNKYIFEVYTQSAFMYYYLSNEEYKKYYGQKPICIKSFETIEEIDNIISQLPNGSPNYIKYKIYKKYFAELIKPVVDKLYRDIKNEKVFINNLEYISDEPAYVLKHYNVENEFNCAFAIDNEDIIIGYDPQIQYALEDVSIVLTYDDLELAFKLGFPDIESIARAKMKFKTIKAVL